MNRIMRRTPWIVAGGVGAMALGWLAYAAAAWWRFGRPSTNGRQDALLDRYMPNYEVREQHELNVAAPATITYAAARAMDLEKSRLVRAIFRGRELILRAQHPNEEAPQGIVDVTLALGWRVLAEEPGREIVIGVVTQPWQADVRFRGLPPDEFASFDEPGYVKIVWTLAAEPLGSGRSVVRTETRVATTDTYARERFRRYWAVFSPGILLIRHQGLRLVRADAEQRYRAQIEAQGGKAVAVR